MTEAELITGRMLMTIAALSDYGLTPLQSWQHVFSNALEAAAEDLDNDDERYALAGYVRKRADIALMQRDV